MASAGILAGALAIGVAVGVLNNVVSGWVHAFVAKTDREAAQKGPTVFALQFILRMVLSLGSLYAAHRLSAGDPLAVFMNLGGLLGARYYLLWKVSRASGGGGAV